MPFIQYPPQVTEQFPDDVEAWIELAGILQYFDFNGALNAYSMASSIFKENIKLQVPPEIINNMAALYHKLDQLDSARDNYKLALSRCKQEEDSYYNTLSVTLSYNLARLYEALHRTDKAESLYKIIYKEHPNYIDCYLRLGCMARDREQIFEASHWFKEALQIDHHHPDPWSLIGNLHLSKNEYGPGQKKFELILQLPQTAHDAYSSLSLGNVWLQTIHQPMRDRSKEKRHQDRALSYFREVLKRNPKNLFAANGIGAVLAHKGFIQEARSIFAQVRDATADIPDVWLNLAHIFVEQRQYVSAIQLYTNCLNRFYKGNNTEIMLFVSQAHFKNGDLNKCKFILMRARHLSPGDNVILFNLAFVMEKLAISILKQVRSHLKNVLEAVRELELAQKYFHFLSKLTDGRSKLDPYQANLEAKACSDILSQAQHHVGRARKLDEEERALREKQEQAKEDLKTRIEKERVDREKRGEEDLKRQREMREQFKVRAEERLVFSQEVKEPKESRKRAKKDTVEYRSDGEDGIVYERPKKRKVRSAGTGGGRRETKKREKSGTSGPSGSKRERAKNLKIKSKEFIDSEDESSDGYIAQPPPASLPSVAVDVSQGMGEVDTDTEQEMDTESNRPIELDTRDSKDSDIVAVTVHDNSVKGIGRRRARISDSDSSLDFDS